MYRVGKEQTIDAELCSDGARLLCSESSERRSLWELIFVCQFQTPRMSAVEVSGEGRSQKHEHTCKHSQVEASRVRDG